MRALGLWLALVYLLVMVAVAGDLRLGMRAWVGSVWVVVAWFFMARTKTLTWSGYMRFFAACGVWSMAAGLLLVRMSSWRGMSGPDGAGPGTLIAGIGEESLKLVPLVLVAVAAPRRVARFATVDFALLGIASGAAFQGVEEAMRRTWYATSDSWYLQLERAQYGDGLPPGWRSYGLWPVPSEFTNDVAAFGGHPVSTGIVAALVGLGVVAWRSARSRGLVARGLVRATTVTVVVVALLSVMADHVISNAHSHASTEVLLDPERSGLPWWLRVPWSALGHGHYRPAVLVVLLVTCLAVDAFRLAARPSSSLDGRSAPRWIASAGAGLSAWHARAAWPSRAAANALNGLLALVWVTGRDLVTMMATHARVPGETRRVALARGGTVVSLVRGLRETSMDLAATPVRPARIRAITLGALSALAVLALVVAPGTASNVTSSMTRQDRWLGGRFDDLSALWSSLSPGQQMLVGLGVAGLVALSGGSLALSLGVSGAVMWGLDKSGGIATFVRDPNQATSDYFATTTPTRLLVDTAEFALTFGPGNFAGAAVGRGARAAAREYAYDSEAFWARRRAMAGDTGAAEIPFGRPVTMDTCDEAAFQGVPHVREKYAKELADGKSNGNHSWIRDLTDDEAAAYLDSYVSREEGWILDDGCRAWYDREAGIAIIRKSPYSATAYRISFEKFLDRAVEYGRFAP